MLVRIDVRSIVMCSLVCEWGWWKFYFLMRRYEYKSLVISRNLWDNVLILIEMKYCKNKFERIDDEKFTNLCLWEKIFVLRKIFLNKILI